jgi:hypothetical protein
MGITTLSKSREPAHGRIGEITGLTLLTRGNTAGLNFPTTRVAITTTGM